jgi:hypothetical protein
MCPTSWGRLKSGFNFWYICTAQGMQEEKVHALIKLDCLIFSFQL